MKELVEQSALDVAIVAVGTELLLGQIVDTNSAFIAASLAAHGISSHLQIKVGDNHQRIVRALRIALEQADVVITTGGLGPTQDDITREAVSEVSGRRLIMQPSQVELIRSLFEQRGRPMPDNNLRQAMVPEGAIVIRQRKGTAPGLIVPFGDKVIISLPGVPYELEDMLPEVMSYLQALNTGGGVIRSRVIKTWGLGESKLAEMVAPRVEAVEGTGVTIAFLASGIEGIKVRLTVRADDEGSAEYQLGAEEQNIRAILGDYVFGTDDDTLEGAVASQLEKRSFNLATAESLTGGMLASRLVRQPGASRWFKGGVVSYASQVKHQVLGVRAEKVVSAEAAEEMALGVCRLLGTDVAVSTTGVAGPDSLEGNPAGRVFIGIAIEGKASSREVWLMGDRERIRVYATATALDLLRLTLEGSERGLRDLIA
jgi:nicotinamide-nucleotide amidase